MIEKDRERDRDRVTLSFMAINDDIERASNWPEVNVENLVITREGVRERERKRDYEERRSKSVLICT